MKNLFLTCIAALAFIFGMNLAIAHVSPTLTPTPEPKVAVCHHTESTSHPWEAQLVDANELQSHLDNGDFLYGGPLKDNGQPTKDGDDWCEEHVSTPSPTLTPTPSETPTPTVPVPTPTPTQSEVPTPDPSPTPTDTQSPTPTPTDSPTASPSPTNEASNTPGVSPTPTPTPTESPTPSDTPCPQEECPTVSPTPTENPTPAPTSVVLSGGGGGGGGTGGSGHPAWSDPIYSSPTPQGVQTPVQTPSGLVETVSQSVPTGTNTLVLSLFVALGVTLLYGIYELHRV